MRASTPWTTSRPTWRTSLAEVIRQGAVGCAWVFPDGHVVHGPGQGNRDCCLEHDPHAQPQACIERNKLCLMEALRLLPRGMAGARMQYVDVFNGDADGLCALHQLRLADPRDDALLVTGVKRDIELLSRVPQVAGARVTVLDVSLERNRVALLTLLACGMEVDYFDHHFAGEIPQHAALRVHIDATADVCTSMLVDRHIGGRYRAWAVVGAFGDNMRDAARQLAAPLDLPEPALEALRELGECLNYNAYGDIDADLFMPPEQLYRLLRRHADPWQFVAQEPVLATIRDGRARDIELAIQTRPFATCAGAAVYLLPDAPWSRRVRGIWGNQLAQAAPDTAHALLTPIDGSAYVVSVRAPRRRPYGADQLCRAFPGGGGRAAAAGIDRLPHGRLADFVAAFEQAYGADVPD